MPPKRPLETWILWTYAQHCSTKEQNVDVMQPFCANWIVFQVHSSNNALDPKLVAVKLSRPGFHESNYIHQTDKCLCKIEGSKHQ